jgi:hypothetical protein
MQPVVEVSKEVRVTGVTDGHTDPVARPQSVDRCDLVRQG